MRIARNSAGGGEAGRIRPPEAGCRVGGGGRRCPAPGSGIHVGGKRPPESEDEQRRLASTLHALDHASRLAETVGEETEFDTPGGSEDISAAEVCAEAMRGAASLAAEVAALPASSHAAGMAPGNGSKGPLDPEKELLATGASTEQTLAQLEQCAKALGELRKDHRNATLGSVASGELTADEAIARVDAVRRLEAIAYHAWRSAAHLVGRGA